MRGARTIVLNVGVLALAWIVWQLTARAAGSSFFPGPASVVTAYREILQGGDVQGQQLWAHIWASLVRVFVGFAAAAVTGVPLAIVLLSGFSRYAFIIWIGAFFPVLVATMAGIQRVSPLLIEVGKAFGARRPFIILRIVAPGALPEIVAGMRIGLGVGWMCIVAAEMIGGENLGLGRLMMNYADLLRVDMVIVGMITIGIIGYVTNEILLLVEQRLFAWRRAVKV
jgi:ABC-type nitrate/sulfonate/bicarbonate transport system permease component